MPLHVRLGTLAAAPLGLLLLVAGPVLAHGQAPPPLDPFGALRTWVFDPLPWAALALALAAYLAAVVRVNRDHPRNPVPRRRIGAWVAGLFIVLIALQSAVDLYADALFSVHMVQHLLLTMVAAPLLALGAPITLLLRVSSPRQRRGLVLPILHSPVVRIISFPVITWTVFALVMWATHFSPIFNAALEEPLLHQAEHMLYIAAGLLFWWPVVGADPSPWRMAHPARIGYLLLGMPQQSFLGLAIVSSPSVLYAHYVTLERAWGLPPLADQQLAGGIMWAGGDFLFLIPAFLAIGAWFRAEEAKGARYDEQLARRRAAEELRASRG